MIDVDDAVRETLVSLTEPLPYPMDTVVFAAGLVVTEAVLDAAFSVSELVLLPLRAFGVIR